MHVNSQLVHQEFDLVCSRSFPHAKPVTDVIQRRGQTRQHEGLALTFPVIFSSLMSHLRAFRTGNKMAGDFKNV